MCIKCAQAKPRLAALFETIRVYGEILPPLKGAHLRGGPRSLVNGDGLGLRERVQAAMLRKRISVAGAGHFLNQTASPDRTKFTRKAGMPSGQAGRLLSALTKSKA